jgi:hypothetical protein
VTLLDFAPFEFLIRDQQLDLGLDQRLALGLRTLSGILGDLRVGRMDVAESNEGGNVVVMVIEVFGVQIYN